MAYAYKAVSVFPFDESVRRLQHYLAKDGLEIINHVNVRHRLKKDKAGDIGNYVIFAAVNPKVAKWALSREPGLGVLLPINFGVYEVGKKTVISCILPTQAVKITKNMALRATAILVEHKMKKAVDEAAGKKRGLF